jgi:predicted O-methyltransferase YrrM
MIDHISTSNLTFFLHKSFHYFCQMINLQLLSAFLRHRLKSKTRHGLHSPFVYNLTDKVIYDFKAREVYDMIEELRQELLKDERSITITDLGAGSLVNNNRQKKIKQLAKNALKPAKLAQLIHRFAEEFKPRNIIELGTCLGLTTSYLATAVPGARVITVEGCPNTAGVAKENIAKLQLSNTEVLTGNFDDVLPDIIKKEKELDFVFIDGNHRKEATLDYLGLCLPAVNESSVLIFDDIYWSKGMEEAWEQIKAHPQVTVTIDLFWIGLVFFRKGQAKEHFKIKF